LRLAIADYDRVAALADGRVSVDGIDLAVEYLAPSQTFYRMLSADEFDLSEMSAVELPHLPRAGAAVDGHPRVPVAHRLPLSRPGFGAVRVSGSRP